MHRYHRRRHNPSLESDVMNAALAAGGLLVTNTLDVHLVNPTLARFGLPQTGLLGEVADAFTTFGTAWGGGKVAEMVGVPKRYVDPAVFGGEIMAAGKLGAAFIPGVSISATPPIFFQNQLAAHGKTTKAIATSTGGSDGLGTNGVRLDQSQPSTDALDGGL